MKWFYYISGVKFGEFLVSGCDKEILYRWISKETGLLGGISGEFKPFTERDSYLLTAMGMGAYSYSKMDVLFYLTNLHIYQKALAGRPEYVHDINRQNLYRGENGLYIDRLTLFPINIQLNYCNEAVAFIMPQREHNAVLVREGYEELTVLRQWRDNGFLDTSFNSTKLSGYSMTTVEIPVRQCNEPDGSNKVSLTTDIMLPFGADADNPVPTILVKTQYGREHERTKYEPLVYRGYAVAIQDERQDSPLYDYGKGFFWKRYTIEDAQATLKWIDYQFWSDGKAGMIGASFLGYSAFAGAATGVISEKTNEPVLKAIISIVPGVTEWQGFRPGGTACSNILYGWDKAIIAAHPLYDRWWASRDPFAPDNYNSNSENVRNTAVMLVASWFDYNRGITEASNWIIKNNPSNYKVIAGPWGHGVNNNGYDLQGAGFMGINAMKDDLDLEYFKWFEHFVRGKTDICTIAKTEYYDLCEYIWKTTETWPPAVEMISIFLGSSLLPSPNQGSDVSSYAYNPNENRYNGLVFESPPRTENILLIGYIDLELYLSATTPDVDLVVSISRVLENESVVTLPQGEVLDDGNNQIYSMLSALKHRNGFENTEYLIPGKIYKITLRSCLLSDCFNIGERLRLTIQSSSSNISCNPNPAFISIYHNKKYPSRIILPKSTA